MLTTETQNLPQPLARAQAAYHDRTDGAADPFGRAIVTALLDPARVREPDVSVPFESWIMGRMTVSFAGRADRRGPGGPCARPA
ncbi:MAG: hypothetical protein J2P27_02830 [Actinobacteria bacterium]|nr:hypothetical protein [Actinomycetota bacterium]